MNTNDNSILTFNPPPDLKLLFKPLHELTAESNKRSPEIFINCRNLDIDEIQKMKNKQNSQFSFHTNSCSLNKKFEYLEYLLEATIKTFDGIEKRHKFIYKY